MKDSAIKLELSVLFFSIFYVGAFGEGEVKEYASNLSVIVVAFYALIAIFGVIDIETSNFEPIRYHPWWIQLIARSSAVGTVIISSMVGWFTSAVIICFSLVVIDTYKKESMKHFSKLK